MRIERDSINRTIRTLAQGELIVATAAVLQAFGVPITTEQLHAVQAFVAALATVVLAWNAVEDTTGRRLLK